MALSSDQVIAVVGIAGTLLGAVVGAVVAPWASGRTERRLRVLDRRMDAYTELLDVAGQMRENAELVGLPPRRSHSTARRADQGARRSHPCGRQR